MTVMQLTIIKRKMVRKREKLEKHRRILHEVSRQLIRSVSISVFMIIVEPPLDTRRKRMLYVKP